MKHSKLSPSAAHRWQACPASVLRESFYADSGANYFSAKGSCAHHVAAQALETNRDCSEWLGQKLDFDGFLIDVDSEMVEMCQLYVEAIREKSRNRILFVEQKLDFSPFVGQPDAYGTADAVIVDTENAVVYIDDLKSGRKAVGPGPQLPIYALGTLRILDGLVDPVKFVFTLHQPAISSGDRPYLTTTWEMTAQEIRDFAFNLHKQAALVVECLESDDMEFINRNTVPGTAQCEWCKAKVDCPALVNTLTVDVKALDIEEATKEAVAKVKVADEATLNRYAMAAPLVRLWCDAVEARTFSHLTAGGELPDFKLVRGKPGNRAWSDESEAAAAIKAMRLPDTLAYPRKLITPPQLEKLAKEGTLGPRQWAKLQDYITRPEGALKAVRKSAPGEAVRIQRVTENEFSNLLGEQSNG